MFITDEIGLSGLAALGTLGSVCAILLRSTHQNLKTLDTMRRDAAAATDKLRQELREHDDTIFKLQAMCADYRLTIAKLEAQLLRRASLGMAHQSPTDLDETNSSPPSAREVRQTSSTSTAEKYKFKTDPEDVLD